MCLSCGCNEPDDDHGDPRNITMSDLREAGEAANGINVNEVVDNIQKGVVGGGAGTTRQQQR